MKKLLKKLFIVMISLGLFSCAVNTTRGDFVFDEKGYNSALEEWKKAELKNYSFDYKYGNDLFFIDYHVTVVDGIGNVTATSKIVEDEQDEGKKAQKKAVVDEKAAESKIKTMDDLFESIFLRMQQDKNEYDSNPDGYSSGVFSVEYDSELHYIKTAHSTLSPSENKNIDGDYYYSITVSNFTKNM